MGTKREYGVLKAQKSAGSKRWAKRVFRRRRKRFCKAKPMLSPLYYEGTNTISLTNKKLSLDKRLPQLRPCFQPQNKSYPQLLSPEWKGSGKTFLSFFSGVAVLGLGQFSFLIVRWVDILFWFFRIILISKKGLLK